jgi:hypothetical protein
MSKLQQEQEKKKKSKEAKEIIEAVGEKGKKGVKAAQEYFKQEEKKEKKLKDVVLETLQDRRKSKLAYNGFLGKLLMERLTLVDWPDGWSHLVSPTEKGVVMELKSPDVRTFRAAFASTGDPIYDFNAVESYVLRAENTIDRISGRDGSGIILS